MVLVIEAAPAHGYSSCDHLFTGAEADSVVGRKFRSLSAACTAADKTVATNADRRAVWGGAHVRLRVRLADGSIVSRTT